MDEGAVWIAVTVMVSNLAATIATVIISWLNRRKLEEVRATVDGDLNGLPRVNGRAQRSRGREEGREEGQQPSGPP